MGNSTIKHMLVYGVGILLLGAAFSIASAGEAKHGAKSQASKHGQTAKAQGAKHGHHFVAHWAKSLSDEQKVKVDTMHLALDRERFILRGQLETEQARLNALAAQDNADQKAIYAQIDKVLEVRREMMRKRYDHLLEMRAVLTDDQRLSYDMATLGRAGVREGKVD